MTGVEWVGELDAWASRRDSRIRDGSLGQGLTRFKFREKATRIDTEGGSGRQRCSDSEPQMRRESCVGQPRSGRVNRETGDASQLRPSPFYRAGESSP